MVKNKFQSGKILSSDLSRQNVIVQRAILEPGLVPR